MHYNIKFIMGRKKQTATETPDQESKSLKKPERPTLMESEPALRKAPKAKFNTFDTTKAYYCQVCKISYPAGTNHECFFEVERDEFEFQKCRFCGEMFHGLHQCTKVVECKMCQIDYFGANHMCKRLEQIEEQQRGFAQIQEQYHQCMVNEARKDIIEKEVHVSGGKYFQQNQVEQIFPEYEDEFNINVPVGISRVWHPKKRIVFGYIETENLLTPQKKICSICKHEIQHLLDQIKLKCCERTYCHQQCFSKSNKVCTLCFSSPKSVDIIRGFEVYETVFINKRAQQPQRSEQFLFQDYYQSLSEQLTEQNAILKDKLHNLSAACQNYEKQIFRLKQKLCSDSYDFWISKNKEEMMDLRSILENAGNGDGDCDFLDVCPLIYKQLRKERQSVKFLNKILGQKIQVLTSELLRQKEANLSVFEVFHQRLQFCMNKDLVEASLRLRAENKYLRNEIQKLEPSMK